MKHKKRIIAIILSLLMLFSAIPAYAANDEDTLNKTKFDVAVPNEQAEEIHFCKKTIYRRRKLRKIKEISA